MSVCVCTQRTRKGKPRQANASGYRKRTIAYRPLVAHATATKEGLIEGFADDIDFLVDIM